VSVPATTTRRASSRPAAHPEGRTLALWGERAPWSQVRGALVRLLAVVIVITATVIAMGEAITHWSALATVRSWDVSFERTLAAHRSPVGNHLTLVGTWFAETIPVLDLTIFAVDLVAAATRRWRAAAFVAMAVAGEKLIYAVSVVVVGRPRPPVPTVGHTYATSSFPSGHVGSAVTLYGAVALLVWWSRPDRRLRSALALAAAIVLPLVVAFCRMDRGFHFPSDVVTGALIGVAWLTTCAVVLRPRRAVAPSA
jgi:undecaprenyl-diphosphatase